MATLGFPPPIGATPGPNTATTSKGDIDPVLGIPNIYEALSLGPNNSTKLFGSCQFTYKSWALAPAM